MKKTRKEEFVMKRKLLPLMIIVLFAVIASAVLFSLRPLGYTVSDGRTEVRPAPIPQQPLNQLTVGNAEYPGTAVRELLQPCR